MFVATTAFCSSDLEKKNLLCLLNFKMYCFTLTAEEMKIHPKSEQKDKYHGPATDQIDCVGGIGNSGGENHGVDRTAECSQEAGYALKGKHFTKHGF